MRRAILALVCTLSIGSKAQVFLTAADGPWIDPATWACNCVPSVADSVEIAHHVTIQNSITLTNAWVHITPDGWMGYTSMGFLAITQPVLNEGTLYIIGDLDIDWPFDSPGHIEVNGDLFNDDSVNIGSAGLIRVNGNMANDGIIVGGGAICVSGITINNGDLLGTFDLCDGSPTTVVPPIIDTNNGTVDPGIVFCESGKCTVGLDEALLAQVTVAPNPTHGALLVEGLPLGASCTLHDAMGRTLSIDVERSDARRRIDLIALPAGTYVLRVCVEQGCRAFRVLKT
jgi:hypothetical protein